MGESLVEAPKVENKIGETVTHVPCLQESVSFGRFEHDSLCWERWSTFPTNKYLEEVEKCSTPGSVAQKKAYFEAHYKMIAARKAELLNQERNKETESVNSEDQSQPLMDSVSNSSEEGSEIGKSSSRSPVCGTEQENIGADFMERVNNVRIDVPTNGVDINDKENNVCIDVPTDGVPNIDEENNVVNSPGKVNVADIDASDGDNIGVEENNATNITTGVSEHIDEQVEGTNVVNENEMQPLSRYATEDLCLIKQCPGFEPTDSVKEEVAPKLVSQDKEHEKEELPQVKVGEREMVLKQTRELLKVETPKKMQKATTVKRTAITTSAKKTIASPMPRGSAAPMPKSSSTPMPKSPILSTPKSSKPLSSKTVMSTKRPSVKKENGFTPLTTKKAARTDSKRVPPTSLHMSLSLDPANSDPTALTTSRKSLIMESMADKDIVRRAFKTFQNCNKLSTSSLTSSPAPNLSVTKKIEQNGSGLATLEKTNKVILRSVKAATPLAGRQGTGKVLLSPGSRKTSGMDLRKGRSIASSFGSRSLDQGNKPKEVSEKLMQNFKTKEAGKTHLQSKAMLEKTVDIRRPSRSINSRTKLSSSCNQGHFLKGDAKYETSG